MPMGIHLNNFSVTVSVVIGSESSSEVLFVVSMVTVTMPPNFYTLLL